MTTKAPPRASQIGQHGNEAVIERRSARSKDQGETEDMSAKGQERWQPGPRMPVLTLRQPAHTEECPRRGVAEAFDCWVGPAKVTNHLPVLQPAR